MRGLATSSPSVDSGAPRYDDHFPKKRVPVKDNGRIVKADFSVSTEERTYLVDCCVAGVTQEILETSIKTAGAIAQASEDRKIREVNSKYDVESKKNVTFVPFVLEVTGSFGKRAREFVKTIVKTQAPPRRGEGSSPATPAELAQHHARLYHRIVERTTAALHAKNASILDSYLRKMRTKAAALGQV